MATDLLKWRILIPTTVILSSDEERAYRRHFLSVDTRRFMLLAVVSLLFNGVYIFVDWRFVGATPLFALLLADRLFMIALAVATIRFVRRTTDLWRYDAAIICWAISFAVCYLPILYSRPSGFISNVVPEILVVMVLYLVAPDNPRWHLLPGVAFSASSLLGLFAFRDPLPDVVLWSILASFLFANLIGIIGGRVLQPARRAMWQAEQERARLSEERTQAFEAHNRLLSMLAHEYRTPLNAITSSSSLLSQYFDRLDGTQRKAVLGRLDAGVVRLTELLNQADYISHSNVNRLSRQVVRTDVNAWMDKAVAELAALYPDCVIERVNSGNEDERGLDPFLLKLIVVNLISNSYKFSPAGAAKQLIFACDAVGMTIVMRDDGPGIAAAEQVRVFDRFFRGHGSEHVQGSGMGLAIVKEAVELLEGSVELSSVPGRTTFVVHLPWLENADG